MKKTHIEKAITQDRKEVDEQKIPLVFRFIIGIISLAALFSFWFFYQVFFPPKVLSVPGDELKVHDRNIIAGDNISFDVQYCKHKAVPSDIKITLVDGQLVESFETFRNLPTGCRKERFEVSTPVTLKADSYHIELQISYQQGLVRDEVHQLRTDNFTVTEPKEDPRNTVIQQCIDGAPRPRLISPSAEQSQSLEPSPQASNQPQRPNDNGGNGSSNPPDEPEQPGMVRGVLGALRDTAQDIIDF